MKLLTAADLLIRLTERTGKSITIPTDLYNIIDEGLREMFENRAPEKNPK